MYDTFSARINIQDDIINIWILTVAIVTQKVNFEVGVKWFDENEQKKFIKSIRESIRCFISCLHGNSRNCYCKSFDLL